MSRHQPVEFEGDAAVGAGEALDVTVTELLVASEVAGGRELPPALLAGVVQLLVGANVLLQAGRVEEPLGAVWARL